MNIQTVGDEADLDALTGDQAAGARAEPLRLGRFRIGERGIGQLQRFGLQRWRRAGDTGGVGGSEPCDDAALLPIAGGRRGREQMDDAIGRHVEHGRIAAQARRLRGGYGGTDRVDDSIGTHGPGSNLAELPQ